ncbi:MAG: thioredoxin family protein [Chthoniobacterales bacterium]
MHFSPNMKLKLDPKKFALSLVALFCLLASASTQIYEGQTLVNARLISDTTSIASGKSFQVGVLLTMAPGWHIYWRLPGDTGLPTKIDWTLPAGFQVGDLQWPAHHVVKEEGNLQVNVYSGEVLLFATVTPPAKLPESGITIGAQASWLVCKNMCVPGKADLTLHLTTGKVFSSPDNVFFAHYKTLVPNKVITAPSVPPTSNLTLLPALLFGFIGGLILNLMPCVLPVISLKMFSFVKQAGESRQRIMRLGLAFAAGMFAWFLGIAVVLLILRSTGREIVWAQQFQNPWFNIGLCILIFLFALNLLGVFEITLPSSTITKLDNTAGNDGYGGAFFQGMFATILGTPCTAPYLGTTLAFALTQPPLSLLAVFAAIALGMSSPYLLICANPRWLRFLPRPGMWMVHLKEFMGFLLLATLVWFIWIVGRQLGVNAVAFLGTLLLLCGLGAWIYGTFLAPAVKTGLKRFGAIALVIVLGLIASTCIWFQPKREIAKSTLSFDAQLAAALATDQTVFVDFTADWCLSCKTNKRLTIDSAAVQSAFRDRHIFFLEADWTSGDPAITKVLKHYGRAGVPLYIIYPADRTLSPRVLPEVITPQLVLDAL